MKQNFGKQSRRALALKQSGFTLIEILVVIGLIAVLSAIVIIAINPARQFAQGRNAQRVSNVNAILNAIGQKMADNKGLFTDANCAVDIPTTTSTIASTGSSAPAPTVDLRPCLVPTYISEIPVDPANSLAWNGTNYNTNYQVIKDSSGRVTVIASTLEPALGNPVISVTR